MGETRLTAAERAAIRGRYVRAYDEVSALAVGPGRQTLDRRPGHDWRMSIPVQEADSDQVLIAALNDIPLLLGALEAADGASAASRAALKTLYRVARDLASVDDPREILGSSRWLDALTAAGRLGAARG